MTEDPCAKCGKELAHTKWNSDRDMRKCVNTQCSAYGRPVATEARIIEKGVSIPDWLANGTTSSMSIRVAQLRSTLASNNGKSK